MVRKFSLRVLARSPLPCGVPERIIRLLDQAYVNLTTAIESMTWQGQRRSHTLKDLMSEAGQSRHFERGPAPSGLPRSTDILRVRPHVSKVPQHEVAALQPAAREQEPRGRQPVERTAMAGWQGQHDQLMYCRRATHDQEQPRFIWQAGTLMRRVTSTPP